MRANIPLRPIGNAFIWDCPLCDYTQGPLEDPDGTLVCDDSETIWMLTPAPPPPEPTDLGWLASMKMGKPNIDVKQDAEDDTKWSVSVSIPLEGDFEDILPPHICYEANVSRERLLTLPED